MNNTLLIYFWGQADLIRGLLLVAGALSFFGMIVTADERPKNKLPFWLMIIFTTLGGLFPSSNTIATMVILPEIVNSEVIQKDLPEIYKMAIEKLKAELE